MMRLLQRTDRLEVNFQRLSLLELGANITGLRSGGVKFRIKDGNI